MYESKVDYNYSHFKDHKYKQLSVAIFLFEIKILGIKCFL